jgi:hypothetical protein
LIAGHYGLAAMVKSTAPATPLWALMVATQWLDLAFVPLLLTGVETIERAPGAGGNYGTSVIHADFTHSLVGALALSLLLGLLARRRWGPRRAAVLAAVAISHWLLDLVVHRPDLPVLPGNALDLPLLGFGLWEAPAASLVVELALLAGGTYAYWRAASRVARKAEQPVAVAPARLAALLAGSGVVVLGLGLLVP